MINMISIRATALRVFIVFLWVCVPAAALTGVLAGNGWLAPGLSALGLALVLTGGVAVGLPRQTLEYMTAVLAIAQTSILVAASAGDWQVDFHMIYFAVLAMLTAFCDWRIIILAAGATAVHHLTLSFLVPAWVFPHDRGDIGRVLFHAGIVLMETGILVWLAWSLEQLFAAMDTALGKAETAAAETEALRKQQEQQSQQARQQRVALRLALADQFATEIAGQTDQLVGAMTDLSENAVSLDQLADTARTSATGATAEADDAMSHAGTVAAAVEEMAATIAEIVRSVDDAAGRARSAATQVEAVDRQVATLSEVATRIGSVVQMIQDIAGQTNLLALNATIEAARAGEAGKGFAVVASEVKSLANQTAKATEDIARQIQEIQTAAHGTAEAVAEIGQSVAALDASSGEVANVIGQQSAAVDEISRSIQLVSDRTRRLGEAVGGMSDLAGKVASQVTATRSTADHADGTAAAMRSGIQGFLTRLRENA
ncbi:MAG: methyl-accepting chemotaxis protein [Azospirillaceae bacterium]|nr:methyl-accepting chemotaxis protein [Azospirillaceae bacterium]